jgi:hypothetical protein
MDEHDHEHAEKKPESEDASMSSSPEKPIVQKSVKKADVSHEKIKTKSVGHHEHHHQHREKKAKIARAH